MVRVTTSLGSAVDADLLCAETLGGLLMRTVARHGHRRAFVSERGEWTYAELGAATWTLARGLAAAGVTKGTRVAILMPSSAEWLVAAFAVALNGAVIIPVSTLASPAERDHILRFSDASVLLASTRSGPRDILTELKDTYPFLVTDAPNEIANPALAYLRRVFVHGLAEATGALEPWDALTAMAASVPDEVVGSRAAAVAPSDDAIVFFTSGSTAAPKAVLHAHRGPVTTMRAMAGFQALTEQEVLFGGKQFFWVGMTSTVGACIAAGACYVGLERFQPDAALDLIERAGVTVVNCSPHQLDQIGRVAEAPPRDLRSLRLVEPSRLSRAAGLPRGHDYLIGYGMTETSGTVCSLPGDAPLEMRQTTNGRPLEPLEVRIVDPDSGETSPVGVTGIVQIKGPTVMRGYLKQSSDVGFRDGYLVTQDLGYLDEAGYFHFVGRANGMIKTNGANVSREEVEEAVREWGRLDLAFVVGVPHPTLGEAVVLVASGDERAFSVTDLEEFLRTRLAAYKLPQQVMFIAETDVPRTASDKIDYPGLRSRASHWVVATRPQAEWAEFLLASAERVVIGASARTAARRGQ